MRLAIVHQAVPEDAGPDDRDVLVQADAVAAALRALGHAPEILACDLDLAALGRRLGEIAPAAVFNLVEGLSGSGRLIHLFPYLLEALAIPCSGCPAEALLMTSNKLLAKERLRAAGVPTPEWVAAGRMAVPPSAAAGDWIVKSVWEHASLGIDDEALATVQTPGHLTALLARREGRRGGPWFAERFVAGREFNLSLLARPGKEPEVLPPAEIRFDDFPPGKARIVDFRAKWEEDSFEYRHTPRRFDFAAADLPLLGLLSELAGRCWALFGLRGYARVDFRVDAAGRPFVLEVNANPCLSPDAGFAASALRAGLDYAGVVKRILDDIPVAVGPPEDAPPPRGPSAAGSVSPAPVVGEGGVGAVPIAFRRRVQPADRQGVRRIVQATGFFNPAEIDVAVELVEETLSRGEAGGYRFLFAERDGVMAGYTCFGPAPCTAASYDLYWIAVDPVMQGRGLGRDLLARTEALVREAGGGRLYIETSHRPQYVGTRAFYERCGFRLAALIEDFYAPGDDRATYEKVLG